MTTDRALHARRTCLRRQLRGLRGRRHARRLRAPRHAGRARRRRRTWVVAGVNLGGNMGDDVTYSGTVGAALEAALRGRAGAWPCRSRAASPGHLDEAERAAACASSPVALERALPPRTASSTSTCPTGRWREIARRAPRHAWAEPAATTASSWPATDGGAQRVPHSACATAGDRPRSQTDLEAVAAGYVALTPLRYDLLDAAALAAMSDWRLAELLATVASRQVVTSVPDSGLAQAGYDPVLFDLDGTVVDSVKIIRRVVPPCHPGGARSEAARRTDTWPSSASRSWPKWRAALARARAASQRRLSRVQPSPRHDELIRGYDGVGGRARTALRAHRARPRAWSLPKSADTTPDGLS